MRAQFQILMFFVCLNLAAGLAVALALPGTEYVQPVNPSNTSEYEEHFNASEIADSWGATDLYGIPIIGDIFSGFQLLFRNLQYLIDGFPMFLTWIAETFIVDATARLAFDIMINALRAIFAIVMTIFVIEFISGRYMME